jgi:hypothetical protein
MKKRASKALNFNTLRTIARKDIDVRASVRKRSGGRGGPLGCALVRFFQIVGWIDSGKRTLGE